MQTTVADQNMGDLEQVHAYNQATSYGMNAMVPTMANTNMGSQYTGPNIYSAGSTGPNAMPPTMANTTFGASWETAENEITLESLYPRFAALPLDQQNYMLANGQDPWSLALRNDLALSGPAPAMQPQYVAPLQLQLQQPTAAPMPTQQQSGYGYAEDMGNDTDPNQDQGDYEYAEDLVMSGSDDTDESVQTPVPAVAPVAAAAPALVAAPTATSTNKPFGVTCAPTSHSPPRAHSLSTA